MSKPLEIVQLRTEPNCFAISSRFLNDSWLAEHAELYYRYREDWREAASREDWLKGMARRIIDVAKYSPRAAAALEEDVLAKEKPASADYLRSILRKIREQ